MKGQTISSMQSISNGLEQEIHNKEQRIHAVYPKVLSRLKDSEIGEDLMDPLGMTFIASGDAFLRMAKSLIDFLVADGNRGRRPHRCSLQHHFGLDHYHLDEIFYTEDCGTFERHYWNGYRGAALAQTQEQARKLAAEFLKYDNQSAPLDDLPSIRSLDSYNAAFIALSEDISRDAPLSRPANGHRLEPLSFRIGTLIQDQSARAYTLLGGGDDEILLYGIADAYLRLSKGIVDFVLAARTHRMSSTHDVPLLSIDLRNRFDVAYSVYSMDTICLADTEAEFEQARAFFRLA